MSHKSVKQVALLIVCTSPFVANENQVLLSGRQTFRVKELCLLPLRGKDICLHKEREEGAMEVVDKA